MTTQRTKPTKKAGRRTRQSPELHAASNHSGASLRAAYPPVESDDERQRRIEASRALLRAWAQGDEEERKEQRETFEALKKGIDEYRPAGYKLFEGL